MATSALGLSLWADAINHTHQDLEGFSQSSQECFHKRVFSKGEGRARTRGRWSASSAARRSTGLRRTARARRCTRRGARDTPPVSTKRPQRFLFGNTKRPQPFLFGNTKRPQPFLFGNTEHPQPFPYLTYPLETRNVLSPSNVRRCSRRRRAAGRGARGAAQRGGGVGFVGPASEEDGCRARLGGGRQTTQAASASREVSRPLAWSPAENLTPCRESVLNNFVQTGYHTTPPRVLNETSTENEMKRNEFGIRLVLNTSGPSTEAGAQPGGLSAARSPSAPPPLSGEGAGTRTG